MLLRSILDTPLSCDGFSSSVIASSKDGYELRFYNLTRDDEDEEEED